MTDLPPEPTLGTSSVDEPVAPATRRTAVRVLAGLAVLLLAADVALGVLLVSRRAHRQALDDARADAVAAARQVLVNLDSISAASVDKDLARVLGGTTGTFRDQFQRSQAQLKELIVANKTRSSAEVRSAGVVRVDTSSATVLVATDRTVSDASTPTGQVVNERWTVDLEKHGGRWLVADLAPVS